GPDVLLAQLGDYLGAGGRVVAEVRPAGDSVERGHQVLREALERPERVVEDHAHELPMSRRRVLAGRQLPHATVAGKWVRDRRQGMDTFDVPQPQRGQVRQRHRSTLKSVVEGVRTRITALGTVSEAVGVRQRADTDRIEHHQGHRHAASLRPALPTRSRQCVRPRWSRTSPVPAPGRPYTLRYSSLVSLVERMTAALNALMPGAKRWLVAVSGGSDSV